MGHTRPVLEPCPDVVLVVDDHAAFRVAVGAVLARAGYPTPVEAGDGETAVAVAAEQRPALVLMDINLPGIDGVEATRRIVAAAPSTVVVLLSTYERDDLPAGALDSGASAYVHKEELDARLLRRLWSERPTSPA